MGCQNSKLLNPDILAIPPKLRPLIWRKVDEIRRRRSRARTSPTLSKKDLLTGSNGHEESEALSGKSTLENESEAPSLPDETEPNPQPTVPENNVSDEANKEEKIEIKEEDKEEAEEEAEEEEIDNEEEEEEEEDEESNIVCPGSPSFRVYYLESLKAKKAEDEESRNDDNKDEDVNAMQEEITSTESSVKSLVLEDSNENEEQETKIATTSRGKNKARIARAIRRGPVAMKHLLNVKSCYHPNNESASLLSKKADQTLA